MGKIPTLGEAGLAWARGLVQREGWLHGMAEAARALAEVAMDYLPARRRLRYGDIDYDFDHRVNTTWARPSLAVRLREVFTRGKYQPSEPAVFHEILASLKIAYEKFTFIDLGSGKGRTLLMASDYPFASVVGAEIIPELHAIALQNIAKYRSESQKSYALVSWLGDAREFPFPAGPKVVYLFNPFPADILREVLERLGAQGTEELYVIYHNLVHADVFTSMEWLAVVERGINWVVYRRRLPEAAS